MFVQHMIASLKKEGKMATIMPHGVLFRGGKEKIIRDILINDDVIEAIISLPPNLFYGTGIPACVLVVNKNKPDELCDKIFFINADAEYAEGKNQNKLRPEDIEKINFVFTHKLEIPKYSRLVGKQEIVDTHDYNLNIRRYVDNTPEPESEDVKAHLVGGVPQGEVEGKTASFAKFEVKPDTLFQPDRPGYLVFRPEITDKPTIKTVLETNANLRHTFDTMHRELDEWWQVAKIDFAKLEGHNNLPQARSKLLDTLKEKLVPIGVLDEFQTAGVFVNWWQNIRYDLKTIIFIGWHHVLIPDNYLINAFFQNEAQEIEELESQLNEAQANLEEALETVEYEAGEEESITADILKKYLKEQINDLAFSQGLAAAKEKAVLEAQSRAIKAAVDGIKTLKQKLRQKQSQLEFKIRLKRVGAEEEKAEIRQMLNKASDQLKRLNPDDKAEKRKMTNSKKDKKFLTKRLATIDGIIQSIGGQITAKEAENLILKKLQDFINSELGHYLNSEKRKLIFLVENLWDKYAISLKKLDLDRHNSLMELQQFFNDLRYLG